MVNGQAGKGSGRRKSLVTQNEYDNNWDLVFGKKVKEAVFTAQCPDCGLTIVSSNQELVEEPVYCELCEASKE